MKSIRRYGDSALLVSFEEKVDEKINEEVIGLYEQINEAGFPGLQFCIPAYCSLTVGFDPFQTDFETLSARITSLYRNSDKAKRKAGRTLKIPVCYEEKFAWDFEELTQQTGKSREEIIQIHTHTCFRVYMLGFIPGFTYMGGLPRELYASRKKSPRLKVPARSVGIAGIQTGIYPSEAPGGWQLIGRTPVEIFDPRNLGSPALFQPGDQVYFYQIDRVHYEAMEERIGKEGVSIEEFISK